MKKTVYIVVAMKNDTLLRDLLLDRHFLEHLYLNTTTTGYLNKNQFGTLLIARHSLETNRTYITLIASRTFQSLYTTKKSSAKARIITLLYLHQDQHHLGHP